MKSRVIAEIRCKNILHNLAYLEGFVGPKTKIIAMVKANAYGHGLIETSKLLSKTNIAYLGVASLLEAKQIRQARIHSPILITGFSPTEDFKDAVALNTTLSLMDARSILVLNRLCGGKKINIHLKFNTGLNRLGAEPSDMNSIINALKVSPNIILEAVFSHFSSGQAITKQLVVFNKLKRAIEQSGFSPKFHIASSTATLLRPETHFDFVRCGFALYGLSKNPNLKPALSLKTFVCQTRNLSPGNKIGYDETFTANQKMTCGTIPIGYADGFRRSPKNWGHALVNGLPAPVIGNVSMDQATLDISKNKAKPGTKVTLIGGNLSIWQIAKTCDTSPYEIISTLGPRIERRYI